MMELRPFIALLVLIGAVTARDHHLSNGNLQQLEDGDFPNPHGSFRFPDIFPEEHSDDLNNGFYPGNTLPRPVGFSSLAGFNLPPLPKEDLPLLPVSDFVDSIDPEVDHPRVIPEVNLPPVDPEGAATNLTNPILDPSSPYIDEVRDPHFDLEPPYHGRPESVRYGRPHFRQPGGRRATRRPIYFSASSPSQGIVRNPGRGIVRGSGPFGRSPPPYVNEPGVAGFMKSFRRLIRTYL